MPHRVCPWWLGYWLVNPVRRIVEHPARLLAPLVRPGMVVIEPGCGMGFFTLELVRLVGPSGRVIAVDLQPRMLSGLQRRARRAGLADRVETRLATETDLGLADLAGRADLIVAIHVVHEIPDAAAFLAQVRASLKEGGRLLVVEPRGHVTAEEFATTIAAARQASFYEQQPPLFGSDRAALFTRAL